MKPFSATVLSVEIWLHQFLWLMSNFLQFSEPQLVTHISWLQAKLTVSANNNKKQPPTHDQTISAQFCSIFHGKLEPILKALIFFQFNHVVMRQLDQFMALLGRPFWTGYGTITSKPHSLINCPSQEVVKHWENAGRLYRDHFMA